MLIEPYMGFNGLFTLAPLQAVTDVSGLLQDPFLHGSFPKAEVFHGGQSKSSVFSPHSPIVTHDQP